MKLTIHFLIPLSLIAISVSAQNLVSSDSWTVGSGTVGIFSRNGTDAENVREIGTGPHGDQVILWKAIPDGSVNADGGWDSESFAIDRTKMYRFAIWIKKTNSTGGTTYFGCSSNDILTLAGTVHTNPYFWAGDLPALDKWYLLVGYVHGSSDPSTSNYGGIYDGDTGAKVASITDYKFSANATSANHRTYLYYDANTTDRQYFYGPEVYQVQTNQPLNEFNSATIFNGDAFFSKKIGIGTASPSGNFHIDGQHPELYITSREWAGIRGNGGTWLFGYNGSPGSENISIGAQDGSGARTLSFAAGGSGRMKILSDGKVGIGTVSPTELLTVNGVIYGKEIKVDLNVPGPDYVFAENYSLPPLDELRSFIERNKHLPGIPSAEEMNANGIKVGEMNMLLLKKIEELSLYVLQLQEKNREQDELIKKMLNK